MTVQSENPLVCQLVCQSEILMALTARAVRTLTRPGLYGDGDNLWLQVRSGTRKSWLLRYTIRGKARSMGLGPADQVSLAEARNKADAARALLRDGHDPRARRDAQRIAASTTETTGIVTFADAVAKYCAIREAGWSALHRTTWRGAFSRHVLPVIGAVPVEQIDVAQVLRVLSPIWPRIPETASRIRGRIEAVLDYARARDWRHGDNPARWRGHLAMVLPAARKLQPQTHFNACSWQDAPGFMALLRQQDNVAARALEFTLLTAARWGEVRGARWDEIDFERAIWTIPAARMKARKEHRVPLSDAALSTLQAMALLRSEGGVVFPGRDFRKPLGAAALWRVLRRMDRGDITTHGFRATFRSWCADTSQSGEAAETALAHVAGSAVVRSYQRSDLLEARRGLMAAWAAFLTRPPADVVPLHRAGATG
jgi:integrase